MGSSLGSVLNSALSPVFNTGNGNDNVHISKTTGLQSLYADYNVNINGVDHLMTADQLSKMQLNLQGGNDRLIVDANVTVGVHANGGEGADTMYGGSGNDILDGANGNDLIDGGAGHDLVFGGYGNDNLRGGAGDDYVDGGADNDYVFGDAGNDTLLAGDGYNWVYGGSGRDTVYARATDIVDLGSQIPDLPLHK